MVNYPKADCHYRNLGTDQGRQRTTNNLVKQPSIRLVRKCLGKCFKSFEQPSRRVRPTTHFGRIFAVVLFLVLVLTTRQSYGSQELVRNGDFETGNFEGWTKSNSYVSTISGNGYSDALTHPPHSGKYSAQIGTATSPGIISQTISIPSASSVQFTLWYRVEKGSSLKVMLKAADKSVIKEWAFSATEVPVWTQLTYTLDVTYAGQTVTIEINGVGYRESVISCYMDAYYGYICLNSGYNDYYAFVDDVSIVASVVEYAVQVGITGLPPGFSTAILVDGQPQTNKMEGGGSKTFPFQLGSSHTISVDQYVLKDNSTRYYCPQPSATVTSDQKVSFDYRTQYFLSVNSPFGEAQGEGWYDEGSKVSVSMNQVSAPMQGLVGMLGAKFSFQKWTGDLSGSSASMQVTMNEPKSISSEWVPDYSIFYMVVASPLAGVACLAGVLMIRRGKRIGGGAAEAEHKTRDEDEVGGRTRDDDEEVRPY